MAIKFPPLPWGQLSFDSMAWQDWFKNLQSVMPDILAVAGVRGTVTLAAGTATVNNPKITATSLILYSVQTAGGTQGFLRISAHTAGSFTITSTSGSETSKIGYLVIEP